MTHSGNGCSKKIDSIPNQAYEWYVVTSDGTETDSSSIWDFTMDEPSSLGGAAILATKKVSEQESSSQNSATVKLLAVLAVIGAIVYFAKKK